MVKEISDDDETSAVTRPYGISDSGQPDDVVSIPNQHTIRQQIQDLCGKGDNDQALEILIQFWTPQERNMRLNSS